MQPSLDYMDHTIYTNPTSMAHALLAHRSLALKVSHFSWWNKPKKHAQNSPERSPTLGPPDFARCSLNLPKKTRLQHAATLTKSFHSATRWNRPRVWRRCTPFFIKCRAALLKKTDRSASAVGVGCRGHGQGGPPKREITCLASYKRDMLGQLSMEKCLPFAW